MKKAIIMATICATMSAAISVSAAETETTALEVGTVQVYDLGDIKLHAYQTNDALADECFIIEGKNELIALEAPGFKDNMTEYAEYITSLGKPLSHVLLAYHPAGAELFGEEVAYLATEGAKAAQQEGGSVKGLIDGFIETFGESFDGTIPEITEVIETGELMIDGIKFEVSEGLDGFDIAIPEAKVVFTHMIGADVHNILPSVEAIDALESQMQGYIDAGYELLLSSHYTPETLEAAEIKVEYAQKMKELVEANDNAEDFIAAVNEAFPEYQGANYLEMSAGGLYQ